MNKVEITTVVCCLLSKEDFEQHSRTEYKNKDYSLYIRNFYALQREAIAKRHIPYTILYDHADFSRLLKAGVLGNPETGEDYSKARAKWAYHRHSDTFTLQHVRTTHDGQNRVGRISI